MILSIQTEPGTGRGLSIGLAIGGFVGGFLVSGFLLGLIPALLVGAALGGTGFGLGRLLARGRSEGGSASAELQLTSEWKVVGILALLAGLTFMALYLLALIDNGAYDRLGTTFSASEGLLLVAGSIVALVAGGRILYFRQGTFTGWILVVALAVGPAAGLYVLFGRPFIPVPMQGSVPPLTGLGAFLCVIGEVLLLLAIVLAFRSRRRPVAEPRSHAIPSPPVVGVLPVAGPDGVPVGWYPDPEGNPAERYWDGEDWTERSRPMTVSGAAQRAATGGPVVQRPLFDEAGNPMSPSNRLVALLLCIFLGLLGVHRFYVGKTGTGVAMLLTLGGLGVWAFVDFVLILAGAFRDKQNRKVLNWS